jgi:transcriptional regulator with AAA-type ATPase domain
MSLFPTDDRDAVDAFQAINHANPFLPERVALERRLLGAGYTDVGGARSLRPDAPELNPNHEPLLARAEHLLEAARKRLVRASARFTEEELGRYEDLAIYTLYHRWVERLAALIDAGGASPRVTVPWYDAFEQDVLAALRPGERRLALDFEPEHLLALCFQVARSFRRIYDNILGTSEAAVWLRAEIWQSIFTHDIHRYQRALYRRMADVSTLVTGPSGTGKELVARAVGLSMYLPFDAKTRSFPVAESERFLALNLSALSPTLIESELFGHKRGAFTGALDARQGWFELCPPYGAVFLDEIGEIAPEIQVKLLRVLQTRTFQRLGDSGTCEFSGKLISATNRDLAASMNAGRFREDLYYRICSDRIVTPSLAEQVEGSMEELETLARFIARRLVGDEAPELAAEVVEWVELYLGVDYPWPGNFRELEQCVRSVLIRKQYLPQAMDVEDARAAMTTAMLAGEQTADRVLCDYCTIVYARVGTFEGAARVLELDRRTVKAKVDARLLARLRGRS